MDAFELFGIKKLKVDLFNIPDFILKMQSPKDCIINSEKIWS